MTQAQVGDVIAAIDLGSNSFHLAIARVLENRVQMLHRVKQRVQLAEAMDAKGNLAEAAMARGLECLTQFAQHLETSNINQVRVVATYALRRAPNRHKFVNPARKILGTEVEVIAGSEEARLIFTGVAQQMELEGGSLVIDIGGGSTELIIGQGRSAKLLTSLDMGCVSYHDQFFADGKFSGKRFDKAITAAAQQLEPLLERYLRQGWDQAIGCSGTIKAICQLCADPNQPQQLTLAQLEQLKQQLIDSGGNQSPLLSDLPESRQKVLPAGLVVLLACFRTLQIDQMQFCAAALREGVIIEMSGDQDHDSVCAETVAAMERLHHVDSAHGQQVGSSAQALFASSPYHNRQRAQLVNWAGRLLEVGLSMNFRGMHRHSGYILSNSNLPGFTVEQQQLLGWLGRHHRKRLDECQTPELQLADSDGLQHMLVAVRLAAMWHLGRRKLPLPTISWHRNQASVALSHEALNEPLLMADIEREQQWLASIDWALELLASP
ncbi:exopolyphosphatase [Ferrimonas senticii]|uniref:exopolyphosphatase n=1 Tax=Ferrimonas senticii TaxID=394566 RepID=UPI00041D5FB3|nr:exopolyphosphatase [Ferrimonas senticii]